MNEITKTKFEKKNRNKICAINFAQKAKWGTGSFGKDQANMLTSTLLDIIFYKKTKQKQVLFRYIAVYCCNWEVKHLNTIINGQ